MKRINGESVSYTHLPKVDIPEFQGGIPGIPEVRELPEYTEPIGTVPNDAPKYEKPEFEGGVVPNDQMCIRDSANSI